jgi:hypothetical protein
MWTLAGVHFARTVGPSPITDTEEGGTMQLDTTIYLANIRNEERLREAGRPARPDGARNRGRHRPDRRSRRGR